MPHFFARGFLLSLFLLSFFSVNTNAQTNFVYTNNDLLVSNSVSAFSVGTSGMLTPVPGSPFLTGGKGTGGGYYAATRINVSVVGSSLYVSNEGSNNISAFTINPTNGILTTIPGSPFATGGIAGQGMSLAVTPDNRFLFAAHAASANISIFHIAANGALTPVSGSPFPLASGANGIKISPDGKLLAIAFINLDSIGMYTINANGTLTAVSGSPFSSPAIGMVAGLEINCAGTLLYGAQAGYRTNVDGFHIAASGALSSVSGSPFQVPEGSNSNVALLSVDERFLFVSNQFSHTVTVFNVAADGSLSLVPGSPFPITGETPSGMATNQAGNLLYVANFFNSTITVFSIAANGTLIQVPGSPFSTGYPGRSGLVSLTAFPSKSCSSYDTCLQDDSTRSILRINSNTGAYQFSDCLGFTLGGTGTVTKKGSSFTLQHNANDRRLSVKLDNGTKKATASLQVLSQGKMYSITDGNILNNSCVCE